MNETATCVWTVGLTSRWEEIPCGAPATEEHYEYYVPVCEEHAACDPPEPEF